MKLLSQKHYKYKNRDYEKFWIIIPSKLVKKLNWKKGVLLKFRVNGKDLVINKE